MRVSTNMIYDQGVRALQTQSAALLYTGQQIATGRKILTPVSYTHLTLPTSDLV